MLRENSGGRDDVFEWVCDRIGVELFVALVQSKVLRVDVGARSLLLESSILKWGTSRKDK